MKITLQTKVNTIQDNKNAIAEFNYKLKGAIVNKLTEFNGNKQIENLEVLILQNNMNPTGYLIYISSLTFETYAGGYNLNSNHTIETIISNMNYYGVEEYVTQKFRYLQKDDSLNFAGIEPLGFYAGDSEKCYNMKKYFITPNIKFINLSEIQEGPFKKTELLLNNKKLVQSGNRIGFEFGISKTFQIYFKTVQDAREYLTKLHTNQLNKG